MADEDRPSVDIIANVRAASAIAMAEEKRAKGKTTGKVSRKEAKDAKVKFDPTSPPTILPSIIFIHSFLFYWLLCNHSFRTNSNSITNCFKLSLSITTTLLLRRF